MSRPDDVSSSQCAHAAGSPRKWKDMSSGDQGSEKLPSDGPSRDKLSKTGTDSSSRTLLSRIDIPATKPSTGSCNAFWSLHSFRHGLSWVLCVVVVAHTWSRNTLSMAMVCMVNETALLKLRAGYHNLSSTNLEEAEQCGRSDNDDRDDYGGDIIWTSSEQGLLFSALSWGGVLMALPGSWMINRFGSKRVVLGCLLMILLSTVVTPVVAVNGGLFATFAVRFFMGFGGEIVLNMAITVILAQWIPPIERSTVLALYTAGNQIALILAMPVNAALCESRQFLGGWPAIFYVSGVITVCSAILWQVFVDNTPEQSRWLSRKERSYIEKSLQTQNLRNSKGTMMSKVPWRQLLLSNALWCCVACIFTTGLLVTTLQSYLPTYYKEVHRVDLKANGLYSAMPFVCQLVSKMIFAVAADAMKKRTRISHSAICKGFNALGTIICPAFLIACAFMDCRRIIWALVLLSAANAAYSGIVPGVLTALVCFAPAYTGIVNGVSRLSSQLGAIVAPYIVGAITTEGTAAEWRTVFFIMSGVMVIVGVYFLFCGTVDIQEWAKIHDPEGSDDTAANSHSPLSAKQRELDNGVDDQRIMT